MAQGIVSEDAQRQVRFCNQRALELLEMPASVLYPGASGRAAAGYATYLLDPARMWLYADSGHNIRIVERCRDGITVLVEQEMIATGAPDADQSFPYRICLAPSDYDFIAAFSDGIESFRSDSDGAIPVHEILREVMAVRSAAGEFVARRCRRFLQQHCRDRGIRHDDDFSMAAIWCKED